MDRGLRVSLLIAGVGGLLLRVFVMAGPLGELDGDEAVTALMAERLLEGEVSTFFWAQAYGGSLDSMVTAPVVAIVGSAAWAAKAVMVVAHAMACVIVWRIGRRVFDERAGLVAAALTWVFSPAVVWWSTKTRGFYGTGIVVTLLTLLLIVRLADRSADGDPRRDRDDLLAIGFVVGVAWWTTPVAFFAIAPAALVGLVHRRDLWRRLPLTVVPFIVGGLPWWLFNVTRDFPSLESPAEATTSYPERVERLWTVMIPMLTGLRQPFTSTWTLGVVVGAAILALLVWVGWSVRRASPMLVVVALLYPFVAAVSATSEYVGEPRYGYFLAPVIAVLIGGVVARSERAAIAAPVLLLISTSIGTVALSDLGVDRRLANYDLAPAPTEALVEELEARGLDHLYAEYWLAYRVTFESDLIATPVDGPRDLTLANAVDAQPAPPIAFYRDSAEADAFVARYGLDAFEIVELEYYLLFIPR